MLEALLPAGVDALAASALLAASLATSFITAAFGIGGGAIMLAILALLLPPAALIPVHGVVQIGSNLGRAAIMRADIRWTIVAPFSAGAVLGVILGGLVAVRLPSGAVQIGVGAFIAWSVFFRPPAFGRGASVLSGAFSSFLTMFFGATGPFVVAWLKTLDLGRHGTLATHAACMTLQHGLKTVAFGAFGFAFGAYLPLIAGMIATGFAGTVLGRQVLKRTTDARFKRALDVILILVALRLIWAGISDLA